MMGLQIGFEGALRHACLDQRVAVDLVHLTQEKFSLGVSSMVVAHGKDS